MIVLQVTVLLLCTLTLTEAGRVKRVVGGHAAKAPPPDDPVVFTRIFERDARVEGFRNPHSRIYSFLGIYYAEPPTGQNRYARPVYKRLAGDVDATKHGPPCIQPDSYNPNRIIGDENCLLLNIYTPQMPDETTGLPVIVWIHPGGFRYGSAAQYDATPLAQNGVIVVTPQYRLGSLGIMGDGTKEFDGNLAIFDMAAALRWVGDYISYFGGDPKQIKAVGHGSGAASAMYLSMSRSARSAVDITGVVAMSGTALSQYATDKEPVQSVGEVAEINGCSAGNETEIVKCLRKKKAEDIIANDSKIQTERLAGRAMVKALGGSLGFQPHIEGTNDKRALPSLIEDVPEQQLKNGTFTPIPILTGVVKHETGNAFNLDTINNIFGSAEKFLGSLTDTLMELSSFLRIDSITGKIAKPALPGLASELTPTLEQVLKIPESLNVHDILKKVTESTTDILFNLPAVLTTQTWSQIAPAFMYSFEYNGTTSKGINFLRGLPLVGDTDPTDNSIVGHGDELGYLFDCNDINGNPQPKTRLNSPEDMKVRKNLIDMLVRFTKTFKEDTKQGAFTDNLFKSVTGKGIPFLKVDTSLETSSDFRFCELSVLGASLSPLTSTSCQGLSSIITGLTGSLDGIGKTLGTVGDKATNLLGGGGTGGGLGLLGGGGQSSSKESTNSNPLTNILGASLTSGEVTNNNPPRRTTTRPSGAFGLLG
ncbi:carboxylesterase 1E [Musca vetustissima]|uniref:carboxylesterase 1E n=1 Tax=Musca vetustissima TaxID=27455 RepID=UPI002AB6C56F|nr:carboxylesterase 1E [Musca vetustissima]